MEVIDVTEKIIDIQGLSHVVGNRFLIKDVNWTVNKGERWVVFGENGSGKTTLLSIIAGFENYEYGSCKLFGQEQKETELDSLRKKLGWVSSSFFDKRYSKETALNIVLSGINGELGLRDNIKNQDVLIAKKLIKAIGLQSKVNQPYYTLSKGEQQNILIIRALMSRPEVLILDEPCTGLDLLARERVFRWMAYLSEEQSMTLIYVTHYVEEITDIYHNMLLLRQGKVYFNGKIDDGSKNKILNQYFDVRHEECKREANRYAGN
ncbi:MAG: ATP-binding cassette domain-containing protein [Peptococcaceae bacterium]|nr:ATP-binding cassette domain-containing protein [Peptococcaceae bacterium]